MTLSAVSCCELFQVQVHRAFQDVSSTRAMANLTAGGLKSLAVMLELPGSDSEKIKSVWDQVAEAKGKDVPKPIFRSIQPRGKLSVFDFPLLPHASQKTINHFIEVISNCERSLTEDTEVSRKFKADMTQLLQDGDYDNISAPFGQRGKA